LKNSREPANVEEQDSETPWLTTEAIHFLEDKADSDRPWVCHVSYIKPHWPYIVPEPYASMFGPEDVVAPVRSEAEKDDPQPVYGAFMRNPIARSFSKEEVRETVIPAYMGLIAQCDAELGRLIDHLEATGEIDHTMIVLTSDHGDYLGDHWLGEKDLFHDVSAKVPLIIFDPSSEADATRGTTCDALVEAIDLAPTFMEAMGATPPRHILEGRSLLPFLHGQMPGQWREAVFSEYDYAMTVMAEDLDIEPDTSLLFMVFDGRYKMMHAEGGFRPMLFDLEADPDELTDLGANPAYADITDRLYDRLNRWARRTAQRTTVTDERLIGARGRAHDVGIFVGVWDESELDEHVVPFVKGRPEKDYRPKNTGSGGGGED
jgi:arylsulfatase A-like enzyme